jgi:hypothetical protein
MDDATRVIICHLYASFVVEFVFLFEIHCLLRDALLRRNPADIL